MSVSVLIRALGWKQGMRGHQPTDGPTEFESVMLLESLSDLDATMMPLEPPLKKRGISLPGKGHTYAILIHGRVANGRCPGLAQP
jgi:hypothetical protein